MLMGLPGSYIIATENSYVGSLVELAGGENVYAGTDQEFLTVNTEDNEDQRAGRDSLRGPRPAGSGHGDV